MGDDESNLVFKIHGLSYLKIEIEGTITPTKW